MRPAYSIPRPAAAKVIPFCQAKIRLLQAARTPSKAPKTIPLSKSLLDKLTAVERKACKESFFEFVQSFWGIIIKEEAVYNWHIPFLCEELEKITPYIVKRLPKPYDLIINIPPGTTKSTIVSIMYPVWLWVQDPSLRIITNSYAAELAIDQATKSRDIILSAKFRRLFPEIKLRRDKLAKKGYENTATGSRVTASTGSAVTGKHAHLVINDDPLNTQQAVSEADRKQANDHTKTLSSRKVNKANTPTITIMQRLHELDTTGYLLSKKKELIRHICLPAELNKARDNVKPPELADRYVNGLLDPLRLDQKVLQEAKTDLGSAGYAGQYLQAPTVEGGEIIKRDWFKYISADTFQRMRRNEPIVFFGDLAYTEDTANDPCGFIGTCRIGNDLYITHWSRVWKEFPELIAYVKQYVRDHGYTELSSIRIEPKAAGKSAVQTLKKETLLNVVETPSPKDDKRTRLTAASPKVEAGRVYLVTAAWNDDFVDEVCGFPGKAHDEAVDVLAYAVDYHLSGSTTTTDQKAKLFGR